MIDSELGLTTVYKSKFTKSCDKLTNSHNDGGLNFSGANICNISSKFKKDRPRSNLSLLTTVTTKSDENIKSIRTSCDMAEKFHSVYTPEDLLFEEFKNRGLIDSDLDMKINEYKTNLSTNSNNYSSFPDSSNLSLKIEFNILKSGLEGASTQLYNLQSIASMKDKKLDILENALKILNKKASELQQNSGNSNTNQVSNEINPSVNNFKRNKKNNVIVNVEEILQQNPGSQNTNAITNNSNISLIKAESCRLKRELEDLKESHHNELETLSDSLNKKSQTKINNEKMKFEEKLKEIKSENCFLVNSLENELQFLKNKIKIKDEILIDYTTHKAEIESENSVFEEKKKHLLEKLSYYRNLITQGHNINFTCISNNSPSKVGNKICHSYNTNEDKQDAQLTLLSNIEYDDINFNTNQDSYYSSNKFVKELDLNYKMNNQEMRPYPLLTKSSSKQKITYDKKQLTCKQESINKIYGSFGKSFKMKNSPTNEKFNTVKGINTCINTESNNLPKKIFINPEDYQSNSTCLEINSIRAFKSKFLK